MMLYISQLWLRHSIGYSSFVECGINTSYDGGNFKHKHIEVNGIRTEVGLLKVIQYQPDEEWLNVYGWNGKTETMRHSHWLDLICRIYNSTGLTYYNNNNGCHNTTYQYNFWGGYQVGDNWENIDIGNKFYGIDVMSDSPDAGGIWGTGGGGVTGYNYHIRLAVGDMQYLNYLSMVTSHVGNRVDSDDVWMPLLTYRKENWIYTENELYKNI